MDNATLIDRERLKELLRDDYDMGLIQGMDDIEGFIDECPAAHCGAAGGCAPH